VAARALLEQCHGFSNPAYRAAGLGRPEDPYATMLVNLGLNLAYLGYIEQARTRINEALSEARRLGHFSTLGLVLSFANYSYLITCWPEGYPHTEELLALSSKQGYPPWLGRAMAFRGRCLARLGQAHEGIALIRQGHAALQAGGDVWYTPLLLTWLAE